MPRHHLRRVYHYCCLVYATEHCAPTFAQIADACRLSEDEARRTVVLLRQQGRLYKRIPVNLLPLKAS